MSLRALLLAALACLLASGGAEAGKKAGSVVLNFSGATLFPAENLQFTGQPVDGKGNPVAGVVAWKSSRTGVATVSPDGLVTAVAPGLSTLTASSGKRKGTALIHVTSPPAGGQPFTAVATQGQVNHVLVADGVLYWTEADGKSTRIRSMPEGGGGITDLAREPGKDKRGVGVAYVHLAALGDELFFTRNISGVASHTSIHRMAKTGGPSTLVLPEDAAPEPFRPSRWGLAGQYLLAVLRQPEKVGLPAATRVAAYDTTTGTWSQRITGGFNEGKLALLAVTDAWVLARGQDGNKTKVVRLLPDAANNAYEVILNQDGSDADLDQPGVADLDTVYFWSRRAGDHKLQSLPIAGGDPANLQTGNFGSGLVQAGAELLWVRDDTKKTGTLLRAPTAGGAPATLRAGVQSLPALGGVAAGGGFAWAVEAPGKKDQRILRLPL